MTSVLAILTYVLARTREPSTWAGIAVLAGLFHISIPADAATTAGAVIDAVQAIITNASTLIALGASLYAIVVPDRSASVSQTVSNLLAKLAQAKK